MSERDVYSDRLAARYTAQAPAPDPVRSLSEQLEALRTDWVRVARERDQYYRDLGDAQDALNGQINGRAQIYLYFKSVWNLTLLKRRKTLDMLREYGEICDCHALVAEDYRILGTLAKCLGYLSRTSEHSASSRAERTKWERLSVRYHHRAARLMDVLADAVCSH